MSTVFLFMDYAFYVTSEQSLSKVTKISPMFSFTSFIDLVSIVKSITQLELMFVYCVNLVQNPREHLFLGTEAKRKAIMSELGENKECTDIQEPKREMVANKGK